MKKLGTTGRAWLKGVHILAISAWVGAAICMILLNFVTRPRNGSELHGIMTALKLIDDWVIIPSASVTLITSLLISWLTPWGFFKWRWITVKWILTIAMMLFGTFFMGPWLNGMEAITATDPVNALQNPTFLSYKQSLSLAVGPMFLSMVFLIFVSIFKPWKRQKQPAV